MSVVYDAVTKAARMQAVVDTIDAGSGPGKLKIGTAAMGTVLATIILTDPCGTVAGPVLTFDFAPDISDAADANGTAAAAVITDSDDNIRVSGLTVGLSGTDIVVDNTNILAGQVVTVVSGIFTHA